MRDIEDCRENNVLRKGVYTNVVYFQHLTDHQGRLQQVRAESDGLQIQLLKAVNVKDRTALWHVLHVA